MVNIIELAEMPEMPLSLKRLDLSECRSLRTVEGARLQATALEYLDVSNCWFLHSLGLLPPTLKHLRMTHFEARLPTVDYSALPALETLHIRHESAELYLSPEELDDATAAARVFPPGPAGTLPDSLRELRLKDWEGDVHLPTRLPPRLEVLEIPYCLRLTELPQVRFALLWTHLWGLRFCNSHTFVLMWMWVTVRGCAHVRVACRVPFQMFTLGNPRSF